MSSTFEVPVVRIHKRKHPNADSLSLVDVFGWQVVVRSDDWQDGDLAAYVRPDSVVPPTSDWHFLEGHQRIKVRRFRGEWSHGLLTKAPQGSKEGDNVAAELGIEPYEPPQSKREGASSREVNKLPWYKRVFFYIKRRGAKPKGQYPHYDVEHLRRYMSLIPQGTPVIITEKIHGANALYTAKKPWLGGRPRVYMRSRTVWKPRIFGGKGYYKEQGNVWRKAYENTPTLERFIKDHTSFTVYGEVYGKGVQDLEYGLDDVAFAAFDIWDHQVNDWVPKEISLEWLANCYVPVAPILHDGPFDFEQAIKLANGKSAIAPKQIAEGIVITTHGFHRKQLKLISDIYMEKAA